MDGRRPSRLRTRLRLDSEPQCDRPRATSTRITSTSSSSTNSITRRPRPTRALLEHLAPVELLGLTATPERSDGLPLLQWFDNRIAAELRLWDAIDQQRLSPFAYFGIHDGLDLRDIPWRRGRGYDVGGSDESAHRDRRLGAARGAKSSIAASTTSRAMRALGFCVSVEHARFMARIFNETGIRSQAVWADTPGAERQRGARGSRGAAHQRALLRRPVQ